MVFHIRMSDLDIEYMDALQWWMNNSEHYSNLTFMVRVLLSISITKVVSKSAFSIGSWKQLFILLI